MIINGKEIVQDPDYFGMWRVRPQWSVSHANSTWHTTKEDAIMVAETVDDGQGDQDDLPW